MNQYNYKHFINLDHAQAMTEYKNVSEVETKKNNILKLLNEFFKAIK